MAHSQQPVIFNQQPCRKRIPNTNNNYPTNPKEQTKSKTQLKAQPPESLGCAIIQLQQLKKEKNNLQVILEDNSLKNFLGIHMQNF
jgi:hypothetical protein